ncbi:Gfo/Idh/MocA family protein [Photobacterium sp. DNB23_23_1]|uniref:Gfo/Idh/MocA family oxidoreductase n=1 Tax=Photobacterium pectinilyticum TaxID=2906793 RepID=A0ABT1N2V0_9GAMM|nr:Gfo/Idh/MocA family oxidoreductase [Photobacterium sp. ZSDE20]MCQ1059068.1 Gfo/Idh/MocA family oxidoreductase [Photobacterium sp. ZSDE20]MDD1824189.1 Gfo/Idh/MocA family oxidoreductase [Photobacterium sp. ZSDE20]
MIRLGVIGTNWITDRFISAALSTGHYQLTAVYSRTLDKASEFASKYGQVKCYDSLDDLANSDVIDAVYIASPNSLHAPQAKVFINAGKHVIGEKPLASNITEVQELVALAAEKQVLLFEAMVATYVPNFDVIKKALPKLGRLRKVYFSYCQYSSRYQKYLNGENPNTFNPVFSNGSIMDIGVYPLSCAIALFGEPGSMTAQGSLLDSGVDAHGTLVLHYQDFDVTIAHSKVSDGFIASEIQGEQGTLLVDFISQCRGVKLCRRDEPVVDLSVEQDENTMRYEAEEFARLFNASIVSHEGLIRSQIVSAITTQARAIIGVRFPADEQ